MGISETSPNLIIDEIKTSEMHHSFSDVFTGYRKTKWVKNQRSGVQSIVLPTKSGRHSPRFYV